MHKLSRIKKSAALFLAALLILGGCGKSTEKSGTGSTTTPTKSQASSEETPTPAEDTATPEPTKEAEEPTKEAEEPTAEPTKEDDGASSGSDLFDVHGKLSVNGTDLVDKDGNKFQLRGMSTHGIAWFPKYINEETFTFLRDEWNTNCIRIAMYTDENLGYCKNGDQEYLKTLVKNAIDYATELNMYVIVDWHILHDKTPLKYKDEALAFFKEISETYAENGNIIYEICNEPNSGATWEDIKSYANEVIPVIRSNSPDSVIIVGSPTWSQDIDQAAEDPLTFDNIMYTLHFYAATHKEWLRERAEECYASGLPIFISEFGICDASGNGDIDYEQADAWKELIEKYNFSYMCWNLSNNDESSAILKNSCDKLSGWEESDLNEQGVWISNWFKSE